MIFLPRNSKDSTTVQKKLSHTFHETPDISIISNREATVYGTKGVIEYRAELIRLNCGHIMLTVKGNCLCMSALSVEEVIIKGEITNLDFSSC